MTYSNKQMLRDANGDLIPQYWDITAQNFKPLTGQDGAQDTRLIGSNVEYRKIETILPRQVRTARFNNATFTQPNWANSAVFYLTVYGITGTFIENEGIKLEILLFGTDSARYYGVEHEYTTSNRVTQVVEWSPGASGGAINTRGGTSYISVPNNFVSDLGEVRVRTLITGEFEDGEGVDCEIKVAWLRG